MCNCVKAQSAIRGFDDAIKRESRAGRGPEQTILRIGYVHAGYKGPEYSLYIDNPEGVLILVLFCPEGQDDTYVPVLKWVGAKVLMLDCVDTGTAQKSNPSTP